MRTLPCVLVKPMRDYYKSATRCVGSPTKTSRGLPRLTSPSAKRDALSESDSSLRAVWHLTLPFRWFGDSPLAQAGLRLTPGQLKSKRAEYSGWARRARDGETCTPTLRGRLRQILVSAGERSQEASILSPRHISQYFRLRITKAQRLRLALDAEALRMSFC